MLGVEVETTVLPFSLEVRRIERGEKGKRTKVALQKSPLAANHNAVTEVVVSAGVYLVHVTEPTASEAPAV